MRSTIDFNNRSTIENEGKSKFNILSNVFSKENIVIYIVAFMLSFVSLGGEFSIFSISLLGACLAFSIPALGVITISLIGNLIKFGVGGAVEYLLTAIVMIATLFIVKPRYNEQERNEKIKIGKNVFIATLLISIIKIFMSVFTLYDVLSAITLSIISLVFYKIFVNSIPVRYKNSIQKKAFSIEEVIGASLLICNSSSSISTRTSIYGFSIQNIFSILIVMILRMEKWNISRNNIWSNNRSNFRSN